MTPGQEHALYQNDREAWARYVAPRWAHILKTVDEVERARTWALACPELKRAIREIAERELVSPAAPELPDLFDDCARMA